MTEEDGIAYEAWTLEAYLRQNNPRLLRRLTGIQSPFFNLNPKGNEMPATKIGNKFYVGSPKMNPLSSDGSAYRIWAKKTEAEAIAHAKRKCEETGEPQIVVKIIKVVRPQKVPIIVENA